MPMYIVHYGELGLKGRNRQGFARQLARNLERALSPLGGCAVRLLYSHLVIEAPESLAEKVEEIARRIFGIAYIAPVVRVSHDMEAICEAALALSAGVISATTSFRVDTRRGDKHFPYDSLAVNREVGSRIVDATGAPVRLHDPQVSLVIQIYQEAAYLFIRRIPGPGGLPLGASERVLTLLSGGIDSPAAAYLLMKRGCPSDFVHFHLIPGGSEAVQRSKVVEMARTLLAPHRAPARLYMVSAAPFEMAIVEAESPVATVVFRRFVTRVADRLAHRIRALALVTGESVGQVASQTLPNIALIGQPTTLPILRPLIGLDKTEIVALAQTIGTYPLSILPYRDPCSLRAAHPATWATARAVEALEQRLNVEALLEETLARYVQEIHLEWE